MPPSRDPRDDLRRRILLVVGAAVVPVVGGVLHAAHGDSGDTGAPATECFAWGEKAGACPAPGPAKGRIEASSICDVDVLGAGAFADGQCCYTVALDPSCTMAVGCGCAHGRPLRVEGVPRTAALAADAAWFDARLPAPRLDGLDPAGRARLARFWASVGLNEHASIASFHRAVLELLAHGAPVELIAATQRAAADETRHARAAFTLATRFAGAPIGPAALDLRDAPALAPDLAALAARTAAEGCVAETLSAAAAAEMLAAATDPAVRLLLEGLVRDEIRHAELAWRTVAWAIGVGGEPVRAVVIAALAAEALPPPTHTLPPALAAWGALSDARLAAAAAEGHARIVRPAATALRGVPAHAPHAAPAPAA